MSADFIHSKQGKSAYADCVSPLIHSPRLPSFLPSTGYIKLNDRFVRCCRFPKVCKKNRLTDRPRQSWVHYDNEEGRKEGKEGGRQRERASQSSGDKKRHTLYDLSLEIHHLVGRSGEHGRIQHRKALFCVVVSWCGFYSYYPLMRAHSFLVVLLLRKTSIHITKLD